MKHRDTELSWDDIRLISAIAETGNLAAAAEKLGINHSTVFRRLVQVEDQLGTAVFEKARHGYVPTGPGEELVALGQRMAADVSAFSRKLAGSQPAPQGELRVTTNDTLLIHLLMPMLARFQEAYPQIRLDFVLGNQVLNLSKRDADIAIRASDNPPETLVGRMLANLSWAFYGRRIDFLDGIPDFAELSLKRWVCLGDNFGHLHAAKYVRQHVAAENIAFKLNTVLGLAEAVAAGIGIGPLPCFIADKKPELIRLSGQQDRFATKLWLLTHPDLRAAQRVRAFMDFMAQEITKERALIEGRSD